MKPSTSSPAALGVTEPELGAVPVPALPVARSSGLLLAIPENSNTLSDTLAAPVVTVTLLTEAALAAYHSSPSEYCPDTA